MVSHGQRANARPRHLRTGLLFAFSFVLALGLPGISPAPLQAATPYSSVLVSSTEPVHEPNIWDFIFGYEIHTECDECTGVPEFNIAHCCAQHDIAYESGGTWQDRLTDDRVFRNCIWQNGEPVLAIIYFLGVRAFGWIFWKYMPAPPLRKRQQK